ncbi:MULTISPECIES: hypothetical protein [Aneurinibacillus]|uniref:Uncharacterized protein n=1 Tax=Aneurinibacillus danicus TaxID=267746 RepID=A0A511V4F5_9BACL|nr:MULTISPECIES: hypothetical protein [Aneurinibacillus]GEN33797.1 hypothetical protein ADA01nite_12570 [Aneurinibacillus danicus]
MYMVIYDAMTDFGFLYRKVESFDTLDEAKVCAAEKKKEGAQNIKIAQEVMSL